MKNKVFGRAFLPILIFFMISGFAIFSGAAWLRGQNTDGRVLLGGDAILLVVTAISFWLHTRSLRNPNPQVFVRTVYGSLLVKMMVCLGAVLLYGWLAASINRNAIIGCIILYFLYTILEVRILTKLTKRSPKNA